MTQAVRKQNGAAESAPRTKTDTWRKLLDQAPFMPEDVLDAYAELEREIRMEVNRRTISVCAVCTESCCQGTYCRESLKSPWLVVLQTRHNPLDPPPEWKRTKRAFAIGDRGCILDVGRSKFCTEFTCRAVLELFDTDVKKFAYRCLSTILMYVNDRFHDGVHLDDLLDFSEIDERDWDRLRKRVKVGRGLLDTALWFLDGPPADASPEVVAERLFLLAHRFPQCLRRSRRG